VDRASGYNVMPLYEYECESCNHRFEKIVKYSDPPLDTCPKCGKGPVRKLFSSPAIQFKGSGWYITDYAKKSSTDSEQTGGGANNSSEKSDKSESSSKSDKSESSSKSDKSESKSDKGESGSKSDKGESTSKPDASTSTSSTKSTKTE
jgi:putative FmdB family regulatory protein